VDPLRWKRIGELLAATRLLSSEGRIAFLKENCGQEQDLFDQVTSLLNVDSKPGLLDSASTASTLPVPQVIAGRFRIIRYIAEGGMGTVYEAEDLTLHNRVALKTIRPDIAAQPRAVERFKREISLGKKVTHPNVCRIHDLGVHRSENGTEFVFLTMQFLSGETLASRIRGGPIPKTEALPLIEDMADALSAAHQAEVIHRDFKSGNVMLVSGAKRTCAVVTDFGLALDLHDDSSRTQAGTVDYMAPEQILGERLTPAADIYALGIVMYEMVTGQLPFAGDSKVTVALKHLNDEPQSPRELAPHLDPNWDETILGCLRKRPLERFQSAEEVREALVKDSGVLRKRRSLTIATRYWPAAQPERRVAVTSSAMKKWPKAWLAQKRRYWTIPVFAVILLAGFTAGRSCYDRHQARRLSDRDTVVLADFANSTGEVVFDDALKTALLVSLNQSPFLNVLSESRVSETIESMDRPPNTQITSELAREVCQRAGSKAYIAGSIAGLGSQYILGLKAVNCQSGELLAQEQVTANGKERVLDALGRAVSTMRGELGESLRSVQEYDVPLADATTSSLQALKALSLGRKAYRQDTGVALRYFQEASELDPNFAMAYHDLGRFYFTLDEMERGHANFAKAFALRNHSSEREKLEITATYYENVTGELEKALYTRRQQVASYPHVSESYDGLGYVYSLLGKYEIAIDMLRQSIQLNPDSPDTYGLLANSLLAVQQLEESRTTIQEAHSRNIDALLLHTALYDLAFLKADASAMTEEERWMKDQPQYENFGYSIASDSEAYAGHLRNARQLTQMAVDSSIHADSKETGAVWYENAALREAAFGNPKEAKLAAASGLKMRPTSLSVGVEAALAYAMAGDNVQAESLANFLSKRFSLDTQVQSLWLPAIRAQVALNRNEPSFAIEDLQSSVPVEFGQCPFNTYGSCLYTIHIRGEAYLAAGQGKLAAGEFQKILDHGGVVGNCWTGTLAYLGLARANALQATTSQNGNAGAARALSAYKHFLTLWKDADAGIPVFKQAKSEYAKLASQIPQ
jgi:serine/threonine protein kinase/tetratricopeptide (TPR) repeat protein